MTARTPSYSEHDSTTHNYFLCTSRASVAQIFAPFPSDQGSGTDYWKECRKNMSGTSTFYLARCKEGSVKVIMTNVLIMHMRYDSMINAASLPSNRMLMIMSLPLPTLVVDHGFYPGASRVYFMSSPSVSTDISSSPRTNTSLCTDLKEDHVVVTLPSPSQSPGNPIRHITSSPLPDHANDPILLRLPQHLQPARIPGHRLGLLLHLGQARREQPAL